MPRSGPAECGRGAAPVAAGSGTIRVGPAEAQRCAIAALLPGYARCSTEQRSLPAQRAGVTAPGVASPRIYDDHGLTGTNRERPGLQEALAAGREGDTLVVTKLDRLARSQPDARAITDELAAGRSASAWVVQSTTPTDVVARLLFNVLAMIAEFEVMRTGTTAGLGCLRQQVLDDLRLGVGVMVHRRPVA